MLTGPMAIGRAPVQAELCAVRPRDTERQESSMPNQPTSEPDAASTSEWTAYRPDPAQETRLTIESFLDALTTAEPDDPGLGQRVRDRHRDLINGHEGQLVDEQSWMNLKMVLALLAAYQDLKESHPDEILLPRLREAFVEPLRPFVARATASTLDEADDAFSAMVAITREREETFFGQSFLFEHPVDDENQYIAEVRRCQYHDVLVAHDAAQLTPILCAFDASWIDVIDPSRHGFTFERPSTIGTGGKTCPFTFRRNEGGRS